VPVEPLSNERDLANLFAANMLLDSLLTEFILRCSDAGAGATRFEQMAKAQIERFQFSQDMGAMGDRLKGFAFAEIQRRLSMALELAGHFATDRSQTAKPN